MKESQLIKEIEVIFESDQFIVTINPFQIFDFKTRNNFTTKLYYFKDIKFLQLRLQQESINLLL